MAPRKALALLAGLALVLGAGLLALIPFSADGESCGSVLAGKGVERPCSDARTVRGFGAVFFLVVGGSLVYAGIVKPPTGD